MSEQSNRYVEEVQHDARHEGYDEGYLQGKMAACQDCTSMGVLVSPPRFITVTIAGQYTQGTVWHIALDKITSVQEVAHDKAGVAIALTISINGSWHRVIDPEAIGIILAAIGAETASGT